MDEFLVEMAEILEEDAVGPTDELDGFESWDSLAALSVVAMADARFGVKISSQEVRTSATIDELYQLISAKKAA